MKIYIPNISDQNVGGGWTFLRNLFNGLKDRVYFVNNVKDCDILMIAGITMTDKNDVYQAKIDNKKVVLRVDNVPRKSRNRRNTPHQRLKEFADLSDVVIYQSKWAKDYCFPLCGDGTIIYNGVDRKYFYSDYTIQNKNRCLFVYHGKSELKCFWQAHYYFQMIARKNPDAEFWFINDFGKDFDELINSNFDFWNNEKYQYLDKVETPEKMGDIMRQCKYLIFPSFADASPNTVLEARACGMDVLNVSDVGGTKELLELEDISLDRMCEEYFGIFKLLLNEK